MMRSRLIVTDSLTASPHGLAFAIRLPWYRTLPLSVIDLPSVTIDREPVPVSDVVLEVNGRRFNAAALGGADDQWWYVLDPATLHIAGVTVPPGTLHDIGVDVHFAPPYIPEITLFCGAIRSMRVH